MFVLESRLSNVGTNAPEGNISNLGKFPLECGISSGGRVLQCVNQYLWQGCALEHGESCSGTFALDCKPFKIPPL